MSAADLRAADPRPAGPPAGEPRPADTATTAAAVPVVTPSEPVAGVGRRLLALAVIAVLIAVIVVLVWWGLAR